ncbi:MAG: nucleotidyl transferase AbiEii/AbiGii toxin family protein [Acidobacteriota bacterium]|nr:nucleotidyl transferase AbiEii/AbiGii toxin family protein [Acidobacteriota bacterium]
MLNAGVLTFQEYAMREPLPLATIHEALLDFLRGRKDVVLFGAIAVNAYVSEPRMTQDIDLLSTDAKNLAEELRTFLSEKFHIAVRVREIGDKGLRIYQVRKEGNRHLIDVRLVAEFPDTEIVEDIQVLSPVELIVSKVISFQSRYGKPKSWTDRRDLAVLLLRFPELKEKVSETLRARNVGEAVLETWAEIERQDFQFEDEDEDLSF